MHHSFLFVFISWQYLTMVKFLCSVQIIESYKFFKNVESKRKSMIKHLLHIILFAIQSSQLNSIP